MLGKLLKHEFRATGRIMLPVLGALLILACFASLSFGTLENVDNQFLELIMGLLIAAFFIGVVAAAVIAVVLMVNRFYSNLLKDEGYLMFTLPVNVHSLVWSKLIVSMVWFIVTGLVIILSLSISVLMFSAMDFSEIFRDMPSLREAMALMYEKTGISGGNIAGLAGEFAAAIIVGALCTCLHFYASISLGHMFSNHKVLWSVVFFVSLSFLMQVLTSVIGVAAGNLAFDFEVESELGALRLMQKVLLGGIGIAAAEGTLLYIASVLSLKKGMNLA